MPEITAKAKMGLNNRIASFNQIDCSVELTITREVDKVSPKEVAELQRLVSRRVEKEFDYLKERSHAKTEDELLRPDFTEEDD